MIGLKSKSGHYLYDEYGKLVGKSKIKYHDTFIITLDTPLRKEAYLTMQQAIKTSLQASIGASGRLFVCNVGDNMVSFESETEKELK